MSANKKGKRKSRNRKGEGQTRKENTPKYRPILHVGEPFSDISQPTRRQIWLGRLKKLAQRLGSIVGAALIGKLVAWFLKRFFNID